jgi:hypothetical protein
MKKSKNSRSKNAWAFKVMGDVKVKPALFDGKSVGMGKYMAAQAESGELIKVDGRPVPYKDI